MQVEARDEADVRVLARDSDNGEEVYRDDLAAVVATAAGIQLLDSLVRSVSLLPPSFSLEPAGGLQD